MKTTLAALTLCLLTACATDHDLRMDEKLALYRQHAGAPVESFRYFGHGSGWTSLGEEALALWTRPNEGYLIEVEGPCDNLDFARAIKLSESFGTVHARFDTVTPIGGGIASHGFPCRISVIRPLDRTLIRAAERAAEAASRS